MLYIVKIIIILKNLGGKMRKTSEPLQLTFLLDQILTGKMDGGHRIYRIYTDKKNSKFDQLKILYLGREKT